MRRLFSFLVALIISAPAWAAQPTDHELEAAARNFRISTYQTYRTNRVEYDRRIAASSEAVRRFYLASDDLGKVQIRKWFEEVKSGNTQIIPDVPQIELVKSLPKRGSSRQPAASQRKDGFQVTKYDSNPRFKSRFNSNNDNTNLVSDDNQEGTGVSKLFSNIGKSFLRSKRDVGEQQTTAENTATEVIKTDPAAYENVDDPFAPANADAAAEAETGADDQTEAGADTATEPEADADAEAEAEAEADFDAEATQSTPAEFDTQSLNRKILSFNLTVEMLNEDLAAETQKSADAIAHTVEQLEAADATFTEITEAQLRLTSEQREQLTKLASLENAATEVMTSINELIARQTADQDVAAQNDAPATLEDLRKRVSKILANHAI